MFYDAGRTAGRAKQPAKVLMSAEAATMVPLGSIDMVADGFDAPAYLSHFGNRPIGIRLGCL